MNAAADIAVVGGGLTGGVLTLLLRQAGYRVAVVESRQPAAEIDERPDPRALAVTPASRCILEHCGVWPELPPARIGTFHGMQVWDAGGGGEIRFVDSDVGEPALGYIIEAGVMQHAIDTVLAADRDIDWYRPAAPAALKPGADKTELVLEDGRSLPVRLVVGADGGQSRTRRLAGIHYDETPYPQQAVAGVVTTELAHGCVARQRFLADGPLAFLPMAADHQCGIVWSTSPAHAQQLLAMPDDDFAVALACAFEYRLGAVTEVGRRGAFPLLKAQAAHYVRERLALVGDAAHSMHPLAGQGANMGWLDAACLAEILAAAATAGRDPGSLRGLRHYERWRRSDNRIMQLALDGLHHLFRRGELPVRRLRSLGLTLTDHSGPLKHFLMRHAMGRAGDLPALACREK
ncbi:MAG: UbiH/UbiF/VisC/COQ6 family ubiquinone biosynthesis hydroxylase [Gammaproteobacteria bacterium]|nr:UbiH/UbiF/VisC/COQ6 family ubiquinone biosynthesis hydroxylase [Gammaproteobacteria bacterium]